MVHNIEVSDRSTHTQHDAHIAGITSMILTSYLTEDIQHAYAVTGDGHSLLSPAKCTTMMTRGGGSARLTPKAVIGQPTSQGMKTRLGRSNHTTARVSPDISLSSSGMH